MITFLFIILRFYIASPPKWLREVDTFLGELTVKTVMFSFQKGSTLKGKNLLTLQVIMIYDPAHKKGTLWFSGFGSLNVHEQSLIALLAKGLKSLCHGIVPICPSFISSICSLLLVYTAILKTSSRKPQVS